MFHLLKRTSKWGGLAYTLGVIMYYRQRPLLDDGYWAMSSLRQWTIQDKGDGHHLLGISLKNLGQSEHSLSAEDRSRIPQLYYRILQKLAICSTYLVSNLIMHGLNTCEVFNTPQRNHLISRLYEGDAPILTVMNHRSTCDDPFLLQSTLPFGVNLLDNVRWTVCTQEIGFLNPLSQGLASLVRVLPIKRGFGINNPDLLVVAQKLKRGGWVSYFPEGRVCQLDRPLTPEEAEAWQGSTVGIGQYDNREVAKAREVGRLKWGIAKVIASAPRNLEVYPIFSEGMEKVLPQDPVTYAGTFWPRSGQRVRTFYGDPIVFQDLIEDWEAKNGPHWRCQDLPADLEEWPNLEAYPLYSALARRVEEALVRLEFQAQNQMEA